VCGNASSRDQVVTEDCAVASSGSSLKFALVSVNGISVPFQEFFTGTARATTTLTYEERDLSKSVEGTSLVKLFGR